MQKKLLILLMATLMIMNVICVYADMPEIATDFSFVTDYRENGDADTVTNTQWKYMSNSDLVTESDGTYSDYTGYIDLPWNSAGYWKTDGADARVCKNGIIYSARQVRVSVVWVAPMSGSIEILTNAGTFGRLQGIAEERDDDGPIETRIVMTDSLGLNPVELSNVVLEAENNFKYTTNTALHPTLRLNVSEGDKIFFESWGTGNVLREVNWDPVITYDEAILYYGEDGNIITSETQIAENEVINCSLYSKEGFDDPLLCLTLYDAKQRLAVAKLDNGTQSDGMYTLNLTVPGLLGESEPEEVDYSKWSINLTIVDADKNYKPIMVSEPLIFN